jgi:low affinity Fe/Cu permease
MLVEALRRALTETGVRTAHPMAFFIVAVYGAAWLAFEPQTFNWHAVATMATWFMTLFIQRAEHRDTQAIQAKLDELLHAQSRARTELTHIDEEEPEDIARLRQQARDGD